MNELELIINNEDWKVIIEKDKSNKDYFAVNLLQKTLYVYNNFDINKAKYSTWLMYKR